MSRKNQAETHEIEAAEQARLGKTSPPPGVPSEHAEALTDRQIDEQLPQHHVLPPRVFTPGDRRPVRDADVQLAKRHAEARAVEPYAPMADASGAIVKRHVVDDARLDEMIAECDSGQPTFDLTLLADVLREYRHMRRR